jgi:hypothetical protein
MRAPADLDDDALLDLLRSIGEERLGNLLVTLGWVDVEDVEDDDAS